ncbi:MAG: hypothetical protein AB7S72_08790 [Draconibacterium sp.]
MNLFSVKYFFATLGFMVFLSTFSIGFVKAQLVENSVPASTNISQNQCPCLMPDNSVIFQVKAPNAQKMQIDLGKKYDMVKDSSGVWSVRTEPIVPGFHYYFLVIDDVPVADPASQSFFWNRKNGKRHRHTRKRG